MKNIKFVFATFFLFILGDNAISQNWSDNLFDRKIYPKERVEKRVYDANRPDRIVWHTEVQKPDYPGGSPTRTMGFIEAASDEKRILCVSGFLVQRTNISGIKNGFLLQFNADFTYLSLPRRIIGKEIKYQDRYALMSIFSENSNDVIKPGLIKIDYRSIRLIENGKIYHPTKRAVRELNIHGGLKDAPPSLTDIVNVEMIPQTRKEKAHDLYLDEVLYFEIDHLPLNFKIEIPYFLVNDVAVPLPIFYFEPYNTVTDEWVND